MSSGCVRPGTSSTGQPPRYAATGAGSIVADMTTMRRSSRASHACFASAMPEIRVDAALVELVEDDRVKARQQRVLLKARGQDPLGGEEQARLGPEPALEPDVPPDLAAERPALLVRDPPRDAARRHTARLQHDDRRPPAASAGDTRVVFPAPGAAVTTTARLSRTRATISGM